jgi:hypothetical protein
VILVRWGGGAAGTWTPLGKVQDKVR